MRSPTIGAPLSGAESGRERFHAARTTAAVARTPPVWITPTWPVANPIGIAHAPGTNSTPVNAPTGTERSGRAPTTGPNWCRAPRTAVERKASTARCTVAMTSSLRGKVTTVGAVVAAATPKPTRPTPAAAMNPSGNHAGGTLAVGFIAIIAAGPAGAAPGVGGVGAAPDAVPVVDGGRRMVNGDTSASASVSVPVPVTVPVSAGPGGATPLGPGPVAGDGSAVLVAPGSKRTRHSVSPTCSEA